MPTYTYVCDSCDHEFDKFQSITAAKLTNCPGCQNSSLRRKFGTGCGIIFKGESFSASTEKSAAYRKAQKAETQTHTHTTGSG